MTDDIVRELMKREVFVYSRDFVEDGYRKYYPLEALDDKEM